MILIPAYNPPQSFADLVFALLEKARELDIPIIVVDDGSTNPESVAVINTVEKHPEVTVLRHRSNLGKGSALKLGLQYAKETGVEYVVSADADGQHLPSDIIRLAQLSKSCDDFIIGTRRFDDGVPARSLIGNTITKFVFFVATGQSLSDTQSGLRCIPRKLFNDFLQIPANKYDFELHCLLRAAELKTISTENIQTVYEDGNPTSHFRPLIDSMLIYAVFFRYSLAAISIAAFDIAFFIFLSAYILEAPTAFLVTRCVSVPVYFVIMKDVVFKGHATIVSAIAKYLALAGLNVLFGSYVLQLVDPGTSLENLVVYVAINMTAAVFNFLIMKYLIFFRREDHSQS